MANYCKSASYGGSKINGGEAGIRTLGPARAGQLISSELHSTTLAPLQK